MKIRWTLFIAPLVMIIVALSIFFKGDHSANTGMPSWTTAMIVAFPLLVLGFVILNYAARARKIKYLRTQGIPGTARIKSFERTGLSINKTPQLALELDVQSSFGEHYEMRYKTCVDPLFYSLMQPDKDIPVFIDPKNNNSIYLDLAGLWKANANKNVL